MNDLLDGLNDAQREAVTHGTGPLLIVAGAGTGKTTVLTRRYVHLLSSLGVTTENLLALTFTEKAAGEMEDRVLQMLPNGTYDFWISTFHGFCQRVLERYALEIGLPTKFRLLNETDAWLLLKRHLSEMPLNQYRPLGNPVKFLSELLKHFSRAKDEGITPEQYLEFAATVKLEGDEEFITGERARLKELGECYFAYRKILREEGALDFGDLILETLRLLRESPRVLAELRAQFRSVFVDEFQDTNWAQYELIKLLIGSEKNITVVGDDDQAIYKFRGASLANILQFRDDFTDTKTILLTTNYRSFQDILDHAYTSITQNNPNRLEVRLQDTGLCKELTSSRGSGGQVNVVWYETLEDEAKGVAEQIIAARTADPELRWDDIAILSRSNDGTAPFLAALEHYNIPYRFYALRGLYSEPVVVDVMAMLQVVDGSHESAFTWRFVNSPCCSFSLSEIALLTQHAQKKGITLWQAVCAAVDSTDGVAGLEPEAKGRIGSLVTTIQKLSELARREKPLKVLQHALQDLGYLAALMHLPEEERGEAIHILNSFVDRVKRYEQSTQGPLLHGFLDELRIEIESGEEGAMHLDPDAGPDLVKVLTIHASKGLEFKKVFIVSMVDQRFPTRVRTDAIPLPDGLVNERLTEGNMHLEEERRLFYVAMTRAKDSLTLTGAEQYGGTRKKKPSVFLTEGGLDIPPPRTRASTNFELPQAQVEQDMRSAEEQQAFPLKRRFSFTQLAAFRKCPLQYKFAHIYKLPILKKKKKSFGQSMHYALEQILALHTERMKVEGASGFQVTLEESLEIFEAAWIDEWYESRSRHDEYQQEGRKGIATLHEQWTAEPPLVALLEQPFEWRIGERSLRGAVDRIDNLPTGGCIIYDYKTGEGKETDELKTEDKEQLWLYQCAMEERGLDIRQLAYVYVRTGQRAYVDILQGEKREAFKQTVSDRMDEILRSIFPPAPSSFLCRYCDFRLVCEHRKL